MEFDELEIGMKLWSILLGCEFVVTDIEEDNYVVLSSDNGRYEWTLSKSGFKQRKDDFCKIQPTK